VREIMWNEMIITAATGEEIEERTEDGSDCEQNSW